MNEENTEKVVEKPIEEMTQQERGDAFIREYTAIVEKYGVIIMPELAVKDLRAPNVETTK